MDDYGSPDQIEWSGCRRNFIEKDGYIDQDHSVKSMVWCMQIKID